MGTNYVSLWPYISEFLYSDGMGISLPFVYSSYVYLNTAKCWEHSKELNRCAFCWLSWWSQTLLCTSGQVEMEVEEKELGKWPWEERCWLEDFLYGSKVNSVCPDRSTFYLLFLFWISVKELLKTKRTKIISPGFTQCLSQHLMWPRTLGWRQATLRLAVWKMGKLMGKTDALTLAHVCSVPWASVLVQEGLKKSLPITSTLWA